MRLQLLNTAIVSTKMLNTETSFCPPEGDEVLEVVKRAQYKTVQKCYQFLRVFSENLYVH